MLADILVLGVVFAYCGFVVVRQRRLKKTSKTGCCGCSGCSGSCSGCRSQEFAVKGVEK